MLRAASKRRARFSSGRRWARPVVRSVRDTMCPPGHLPHNLRVVPFIWRGRLPIKETGVWCRGADSLPGGVEMGEAALDVHRGGIAVLGVDGNVIWTDEAWLADDDDDDEGDIP